MENSNKWIEQFETQALGLRNEIAQHEQTILDNNAVVERARLEADRKNAEERSYIDNVLKPDLAAVENIIKLLRDQLNGGGGTGAPEGFDN